MNEFQVLIRAPRVVMFMFMFMLDERRWAEDAMPLTTDNKVHTVYPYITYSSVRTRVCFFLFGIIILILICFALLNR
jgi:hypothetical protein